MCNLIKYEIIEYNTFFVFNVIDINKKNIDILIKYLTDNNIISTSVKQFKFLGIYLHFDEYHSVDYLKINEIGDSIISKSKRNIIEINNIITRFFDFFSEIPESYFINNI